MSDQNKPSQAEGADLEHPDTDAVQEEVGRPSKPEGDDPADTTEVHEVLEP